MLKRDTKAKKTKGNIITGVSKDSSSFKSASTSIDIGELSFIALNKIDYLGGVPKPNEEKRIITLKDITTFSFILAISKTETIKELTLTTYSIGKKNISLIKELMGLHDFKDVTVLINSNIKRFNADTWRNLELLNANVKLIDNHSKILLIKTENNYYCIEGSGNLNHNARIEQYVFANSKQIYDFHYNWIKEI